MVYLKLIGIFVALFSMCSPALSATYYIDPLAGSMDGDGSEAAPWSTLEEVVEAGLIQSWSWTTPHSDSSTLVEKNSNGVVTSGDTLLLMGGYHGRVDIFEYVNSGVITVKAGDGETPTLSHLHFRASSNWHVLGLHVSPVYGETDESTLVTIESHSYRGPSSYITVEDCDIFSADDVSGWTVDDWLDKRKSGISLGGDDCVAINNRLRNISFGITASYERAYVAHNSIINFAGDGMRGLGDYGVFEYNLVANAVDVDDNHDDGFQSWSRNGNPVVGVVLRGNVFHTDYDHPNPDLLSTFQGIGCFDGYFNDWLVVNNLVAVSHYHGISLYGANNSVIINNTVVDDPLHSSDPMVPWIRLYEHKDGSHGEGNVVRNNIGKLASISDGVTIDYNFNPGVSASDHTNYDDYFKDRLNYDFRLKRSAPARGGGIKDLAPGKDIDGRPRGAQIDAGAYQTPLHLPFLFLVQ